MNKQRSSKTLKNIDLILTDDKDSFEDAIAEESVKDSNDRYNELTTERNRATFKIKRKEKNPSITERIQ